MEMKLMGQSLIRFGLVLMVLNNACPANGITCQEALIDLIPCQSYLAGYGPGTPSIPCCSGVQAVYTQATTTEIRRRLCECFKKAAAGRQVNPDRLKSIPQFCKVTLPVPLDPKIDCSTIPL